MTGCLSLFTRLPRSKSSAGCSPGVSHCHSHTAGCPGSIDASSVEIHAEHGCDICDFSLPRNAELVNLDVDNPPAYESLAYDDQASKVIEARIDKLEPELRRIGLAIHAKPELGFKEFNAQKVLCAFLEKQAGWTVLRSAYGLKTAWVAEFSHGVGGRVLGFNAEMDALPGIGHACGHNLIAEGGVAAALGAAAALVKLDIPGRIILLGTPAEENGGGKVLLLKAGAYQDMDACLMIHPGGGSANGDAIVPCLAMDSFSVEYYGHAAHASLQPDEGINALDAAILAYNNLSAMRQQIKPYERMHGIIEGNDWVPNIIPAYSKIRYRVRSGTFAELVELKKRAVVCCEAAALATGCTFTVKHGIPHHEIHQNYHLTGEYVRYMKGRFGLDIAVSYTPGGASTDFGAVSYNLPGLHPGYNIPSKPGSSNHTPGFTKVTKTHAAHVATLQAAKGIATVGFKVLADADFAEKMRAEFEKWKEGS